MHLTRVSALTVAAVLLGLFLRWSGLDRDFVDLSVSQSSTAAASEAFFSFHPDEKSVIGGALAFDDPLHPPFTMYGALPFHLLRGTLAGLDWVGAPAGSEAAVHRVGKTLSALLSSLCLVAVWFLARQVFSAASAALAVLLVAVAPGIVQQAHYYTVDSLFCLLTTASLAAMMYSGRRASWPTSVLTGVLIGLSASVRLNALLLVPVLVMASPRWSVSTIDAWRQRLQRRDLWVACAAIVITMTVVQPYLLLTPSRLWTVHGTNDFAHVMEIVGGAMPQLYTLQYTGTVPFVYQWTHLLPLALGWPITLASALALALGLGPGLRSLDWRRGVLLLWIGLYLLTAGPLFVKPVRYLLPIMPPLLVLAADLCRWGWCRGNGLTGWLLRLAVVSVVAHGLVYGLAYHNIWSQEDSRIQAGRWIAANVPPGATIAVERGAFPVGPVIDDERYELADLGISTLFQARGQLLCSTTAQLLQDRLRQAHAVAITDVNRLSNLSAAPDVLPVVASFYRHLTQQQLGYRLARRFKVYPEILGIRFNDDEAEHSFLGFDHPAVLLYQRREETAATAAWQAWIENLAAQPFNVDALLLDGVAAMRLNDTHEALRLFEQAQQVPTSATLARLLASIARSHAGLPAGAPVAVRLIVAVSLADLGLPSTALQLMTNLAPGKTCDDKPTYDMVAGHLARRSFLEQAKKTHRLASALCDY